MERVSISKNRLFFFAVVIALVNPVLSGLLLGGFMISQPETRREGVIVALFSVMWGIIVLLLISKYKHLL